MLGWGALGDFAIAVTRDSNRKSGMVIQRYLKIILKGKGEKIMKDLDYYFVDAAVFVRELAAVGA